MTGRITIVRNTTNVIEGRNQASEEHFYSCWCEIQDLNSTEKYTALQTKLEETIIFKVRECGKISEMRMRLKEFHVIYKENIFKIYAVTPMYADERKVLLKANRIS